MDTRVLNASEARQPAATPGMDHARMTLYLRGWDPRERRWLRNNLKAVAELAAHYSSEEHQLRRPHITVGDDWEKPVASASVWTTHASCTSLQPPIAEIKVSLSYGKGSHVSLENAQAKLECRYAHDDSHNAGKVVELISSVFMRGREALQAALHDAREKEAWGKGKTRNL